MEALAMHGSIRGSAPPPTIFEDPLDQDEPGDTSLVTSTRALVRLALVASETGARFQREATGHDPMAWLLAPRELFGGESAMKACLARDDCLRAVILHGLSIGFDAAPSVVDALLVDDEGGGSDGGWERPWDDGEGRRFRAAPRARRLRLYSAVIVLPRGGELLHLFHASVAPTAAVVRDRIRARFGSAAAKQAEIRIGVDLGCPSTAGLLPPAFRAMIERGGGIRWSTMSSLDVTVEHRIPC